MHKALHPRDDIGRLYVSRKEGVSGLASTEDKRWYINTMTQRLLKKSKGRLITATRNTTDNIRSSRTKITSKQKCEEKTTVWNFKRQASEITDEKTRTWLKKENLKRESDF